MDHPDLIVCSFIENSIGLKRVASQYLMDCFQVDKAFWK